MRDGKHNGPRLRAGPRTPDPAGVVRPRPSPVRLNTHCLHGENEGMKMSGTIPFRPWEACAENFVRPGAHMSNVRVALIRLCSRGVVSTSIRALRIVVAPNLHGMTELKHEKSGPFSSLSVGDEPTLQLTRERTRLARRSRGL